MPVRIIFMVKVTQNYKLRKWQLYFTKGWRENPSLFVENYVK